MLKFLKPKEGRIFISWSRHGSRSQALAEAVGAEMIFLYYFRKRGLLVTLLRYLVSTLKTFFILFSKRPRTVLSINQPVFCVLAVLIYCRLTGAGLVLDHHAGAFNMKLNSWWRPLLRFTARRAILNTVPNPEHAALLRDWGARVLETGILPFDFDHVDPIALESPAVVFISTFSRDEPLGEVLEAARSLPDVSFFVTGDYGSRKPQGREQERPNFKYTGFMPEADYLGLVAGADIVLCLTTRDSTLQRGAYEAMSLGKAVVTSDWPVLRQAFQRAVVFVQNDASSIARGIKKARTQQRRLEQDMRSLYQERKRAWGQISARLNQVIEGSESLEMNSIEAAG